MTSNSLIDAFNKSFVGFDPFESLLTSSESNFPHHNIVKIDDYQYAIELALAGYQKEHIEIELEADSLTIRGSVPKEEAFQKENQFKYLHKGISTRAFKVTYALGKNIEVESAEMKDGILRIMLKRIVPDHMKPKAIPVL